MSDDSKTLTIQRPHLGGDPTIEATLIPIVIITLWFFAGLIIHPLLPMAVGFYAVALIRLGLLVVFMRQIHGKNISWALKNLGFIKPVVKPVLFGAMVAAAPMILSTVGLPLFLGYEITALRGWLVLFPVIVLGPGLFEEGLFRGYVFNHYITYSHFGWLKASFYSGILFSVSHFLNLFTSVNVISVFVSIAFAFPISFLFGFMFIRMAGNIWGCVSAHIIIDLVAGVFIISGTTLGLQLFTLSAAISLVVVFGFIMTGYFYPIAGRLP